MDVRKVCFLLKVSNEANGGNGVLELSDEVGFIHPSQFVKLSKEGGESSLCSDAGVLGPGDTKFWNRDHKLGISTEVLLPLCKAAKSAFMDAMKRYKTLKSLVDDKNEVENITYGSSSHQYIESEIMKHSRALLLLSSDFGTAWNSRFSPLYLLCMSIHIVIIFTCFLC